MGDVRHTGLENETIGKTKYGGRTLKTLMAIIIAHAMTMTATPTGLVCRYDGNTVPQGHGTRENIITESSLQEFRVFIARSGKSVTGRVRSYNPDKGIVAIAKENGKAHKVDLNTLSTADQAYVREWHLIKEFFAQDRFHISVRKKRSRTGAEHLIWRLEEEIVYGIILENRSNYVLENLSVDYRIYRRPIFQNVPDQPDNHGQADSQGVKYGTLNIGTLAVGEKTRVEIQSVVFPKEDQIEYYQIDKEPKGKILGLWIRIYMPLESGRNAMREFSFPSSLMKNRKWITPSSQNNGQENQR